MNEHKRKCPTLAESGISKTIHLDPVNNPYLSMILTNQECAIFFCEVLQTLDDLLNQFCASSPQIYKGNELEAFIALYNLRNEYRRES